MDLLELESYRLSDAVKFNDRLNPRIWGPDEKMLPEVREKLLAIADDFRENLGIDVEVKDITVSGSNAAYTYTDHSDIDLHLVADLPRADESDVYRELFDAKKYQYNDSHDFKIGGYDVELYVQNANEPHYSQGIYSVKDDRWVKVPSRRKPEVNDISVKSKYEDIGQRVEQAIKSGELSRMDAIAGKIREMRQAGLETTGEFGPENLAFKILRNNGTLEKLRDARLAAKSQNLSLQERKKKKSKKKFRYGSFGGYYYPGYGYYGQTGEVAADAGGGDGGGESVRESRESQQDIIERFAKSCCDFLGIENPPQIKLRRDPQWQRVNGTFGRYTADPEHRIELATHGRHIVDILRTLAHEMTHARQNETTGLPDHAGETGSEFENEANALAGQIMRHWAESEPDMFADVDLDEGMREKIGAVAAAACIAGTPGCATTGTDVLKTTQTIGRAAKNLPTRAGAEEELRTAVKDALRKGTGTRESRVTEASGYIPTAAEKNDPRYSMALTVDIQPGETGRQANKLGLKTDSQGRPALLMKKLNNLLESVKRGEDTIDEEEDLFEVKMSPGELQKWAASEEAQGIRAGFEAELIFRDTGRGVEQDSEPDYDQDERARDIDQVVNFFQGGENGITRNQANRLRNDLYEQFHEWVSNTFYEDVWNERKYYEWIDDNIWPNEQDEYRERAAAALELDVEGELTPEQIDLIAKTAWQMFREEVEEQWENQGPWYNEAEEYLLDEFRDENDESEWLDNNYRYMSDIESEFNLDWPYWIGGDDREGGSRDPEDIADSLARSLGVKVVASSDYHSTRRRPDLWIIEPDGSLSPDDYEDTGLEVVSPPMPLPEALQKLREIIDWANDSNKGNAYTNSSTGLHMGISLPYKGGDVDYVKLILFLGDQYVLEQFGRAANSYAASALEKLREVQRKRRQNMSEADVRNMKGSDKTAAAMDLMRKNLIELAARYVQDAVGQSKYTSAHLKDGYIEFRSPGGDYLSMNDRDEEALGNTMLRFARAMSLAGRPDLERKEYSKKLYKLLSGFKGAEISKPTQDTKYKTTIEFEDQQDAMDLFAKYASGQITPDELKKQWARQVLSKELPEPQGEYEYEVVKDVSRHPDEPARREVITVIRANGENEADRKVRELYGDEPDYYKYSAQRRRYQYDVVNRDTGEVVGEVEDINLDRAVNQAWDQFGPGGKNIPFDVREKPKDEEPQKPLSRRGQVAKRLAEKPTLWTVKAMDREIFVMAPNVEQAKRAAQQDPFFDRNRSYIDVRPSTREEQAQYRVQQADNEQDLEQIQRRVAPGRGRYLVKWTEFRDGQEVEDSLRQEANSPEDAIAGIRRALELQGRTPANMRAELVDIRVTPSDTDDTAPQREYHIYHRGTGIPAVAFRAANDEAAMERLEQYRQQHPAIDVGVRRGGAPASAGTDWQGLPNWQDQLRQELDQYRNLPPSGEFTGRWQIWDNAGRLLHTFGGIGNNQADANRAALRWLTSNGYGSGTEVEVTPEMRE
jgi:hypothetical protein